MVLEAIRYQRGKLQILDQLKLPYQETFLDIASSQDAWDAIKRMQVRGAPAIAIVAALSVAVWLDLHLRQASESAISQAPDMVMAIQRMLKYLVTSRPTAVNLSDASARLQHVILANSQQPDASAQSIAEAYISAAEQMLIDDVRDNENIGEYGARWILDSVDVADTAKISILTHCNTGCV